MFHKQTILLVVLFLLYCLTFSVRMPLSLVETGFLVRIAGILHQTDWILLCITLFGSIIILTTFIATGPPKAIRRYLLYTAILGIPFIFTYPGDTADFFGNLWYAERFGVIGENPYITTYEPANYMFYQSPLPPTPPSPLLPYGPIWLILQTALYLPVRSFSLLTITLLFKVVFYGLYLLTVFIIFKTIQAKHEHKLPVVGSLFMSPAPLYAFIGNSHNDLWFILLLALCFLLLQKKRFYLSFFVLLTACFVKYVAILLIPFYIWYLFQHMNRKQFMRLLAFVTILLIPLIYFAVFILQILAGVLSQAGMVSFSIVHLITLWPFLSEFAPLLATGMMGLFVMYYVLRFIQVMRNRNLSFVILEKASMYLLITFYILFIHLWTYWYLLWTVPFLASLSKKHTQWLTALLQLHVWLFMFNWYQYLSWINRSITAEVFTLTLTISISLSFVTTAYIARTIQAREPLLLE